MKKTLLTLILCFQLVLPVSVFAKSGSKTQNQIAVIEIFKDNSQKVIVQVKKDLQKRLEQNSQFRFVSQKKIQKELRYEEELPDLSVEGDQIYADAVKAYLNFNFSKALNLLAQAEAEFEKHPGIHGGLQKVYLFQAQIYLQKGKRKLSVEHIQKAIRNNVSLAVLKEGFYAPHFKNFYKREYKKYKSTLPLTSLTIKVKSPREGVPVYVNGVLRTQEKLSNIEVVDQVLYRLQAGTSLTQKRKTVKAKLSKSLKVTLSEKTQLAKKYDFSKFYGIKTNNMEDAISDAIWIGKNLNASTVVLLHYHSGQNQKIFGHGLKNLQKQVTSKAIIMTQVDPKTRKFSKPQKIDFDSYKKEKEQVINQMIAHLSESKLRYRAKASYGNIPILIGQGAVKKKKSKGLLIGIGVAVLGGVVGAVLGLGGGGSSSSSSASSVEAATTTVNINGEISAL